MEGKKGKARQGKARRLGLAEGVIERAGFLHVRVFSLACMWSGMQSHENGQIGDGGMAKGGACTLFPIASLSFCCALSLCYLNLQRGTGEGGRKETAESPSLWLMRVGKSSVHSLRQQRLSRCLAGKERDKREETLIRTGRREQKGDLGDPGMGRMGKGSAFQNVSHHFRTGRKRTRKAGEVPGPDRLDKLCGGGRGSPKKGLPGVCICLCASVCLVANRYNFLKMFCSSFFFSGY